MRRFAGALTSRCCRHSKSTVVSAALRAVGNVVTGDDAQTQAVLNCAPLPSLLALLRHAAEPQRKEACWTLSNITAGNAHQIQAVIDADIFPTLIDILRHAEFKTRKEAAWAITNATSGGTQAQIRYASGIAYRGRRCGLSLEP